MTKPKSVSSKDVAREAGVSQATVSYVLNNVQGIRIKPETREAVLNAARRLNYHPNLIAKSMRLKKSMSIGIVTDKTISNFMFMQTLEGIKDALVPKNYSITLCLSKSQEIEQAEHIKYFSSNRIDGIIFVFATLTDEHIAYLVDNNIPFVNIQSNPQSDVIHLVKTDMSKAINDAVVHLARRPVKEIAFFSAGCGNVSDRRYKGYAQALEHNGIPLNPELMLTYTGNEEEIESSLDEFFSRLKRVPEAMLCDSTNLAFRLLKYAVDKGIKVPEDLAVAAIGTSKFSPYTYPALSSIEAPLYDMGYTGAQMLFDIMQDKIGDDVVVLEWSFIQRESS